jgi:hypothetical protein
MASTPAAQPTANTPDQGEATKPETNEEAAPTRAGDGAREPDKPTTGKGKNILYKIHITNKLHRNKAGAPATQQDKATKKKRKEERKKKEKQAKQETH